MKHDHAGESDVVILDTSALLYWTLAPERLTPGATRSIAAANEVAILSVSLWEIALKHQRGALELPGTIEEYRRRLLTVEHLRLHNLDSARAVAGALLDWHHRDPADRWITAFAMERGAPLITSDRTIRDFYREAVW